MILKQKEQCQPRIVPFLISTYSISGFQISEP